MLPCTQSWNYYVTCLKKKQVLLFLNYSIRFYLTTVSFPTGGTRIVFKALVWKRLVFCNIRMVLKATLQKESPKLSLPQVTSEAAVRKCSSKWVFLEISQYSQENICVVVFLIKVQALLYATLFKTDFNTSVFLWMWWNSFFIEHLRWHLSI